LASEREQSLKAGMNDFLTKPFGPVALIAIVQRYLKQTRVTTLPIGLIQRGSSMNVSLREP
jgi:DNA-binding response OmpR family regulator